MQHIEKIMKLTTLILFLLLPAMLLPVLAAGATGDDGHFLLIYCNDVRGTLEPCG